MQSLTCWSLAWKRLVVIRIVLSVPSLASFEQFYLRISFKAIAKHVLLGRMRMVLKRSSTFFYWSLVKKYISQVLHSLSLLIFIWLWAVLIFQANEVLSASGSFLLICLLLAVIKLSSLPFAYSKLFYQEISDLQKLRTYFKLIFKIEYKALG